MSSSVSLLLTMTWVIGVFFEKLIAHVWVEFEKHPLHAMPRGLGILCKACTLF